MSAIFAISCEAINVSATQDILCIYGPPYFKLRCLAFEISQNGQTTVGNYPMRLRILAAAVTPGSGGAAATIRNVDPNGVAATFTARRNDTTQATSGGTIRDYLATNFNAINGNYWQPPRDDAAPKADVGEAIVLSLDAAPGATINISATIWIEQI